MVAAIKSNGKITYIKYNYPPPVLNLQLDIIASYCQGKLHVVLEKQLCSLIPISIKPVTDKNLNMFLASRYFSLISGVEYSPKCWRLF